MAGGRAAPAGVPDPELVEQAKRRSFTAKYKLEILEKAEACTRPGEVGELLRREGLYTSHLTYWRKQSQGRRAEGARQATWSQAGRPARRGDREADAASWSAPRRSLRRRRGSSRSREISQRCWSRCSVPRARAGAPSDDRADSRRAHADHRHPARVSGGGRLAGDGLPPPSPAASHGRRGRGRRRSRALSEPEREQVLEVLHSERFVDVSPEETWATLLDEGTYLCSTRTMYRILAAHHGGVRERRAQLTHPAYAKPELLAERPNELWSWDVSKLKGPAKWTWFYLYVILDVFSRYIVAWTVQYRENAQLATALIEQAAEQQQITPKILTLHADRGAPQRAKPVAFLLADLGITKTHIRVRTPPATTPTRSRTSRP